jgi:hypothetical protein
MADAGHYFQGDAAVKIVHAPDPRPLRAKAYPPVGDQLDAIWKILNALLTGDEPPADAIAVRDQIAAVKAKYRKTT